MCLVGLQVEQLDTPALWVDLDLMEKNIACIAGYLREAGVAWRPHTKGIKIPAIAHQLIDAGAIGVTCSKLSEAEVLAAGGVKDILVANEIVGRTKITRLVNLRRHADVIVAVDDIQNACEISKAADDLGVQVRVLIELNIGMNRCGLTPGEPVLSFADRLTRLPGIKLAGLMGWEGHVVKIDDPVTKRDEVEKAVGSLVKTAELCRKAGLSIPIVSCGGTGSFRISSHIPGITEVQAGGGIFGDLTYQKWGAGVELALFILSTISSHADPGRAVADAGRKAMNVEYSFPAIKDLSGARIIRLSAEHSVIELEPDIRDQVKVGQKVNFIAGYEDLTIFLHDRLFGVRNGQVEVVWEIQGRGKLT